ncbi:Crp/Fnr family transcriptional regulator [Rhodospirillum rubrum]|uniref:Crp/Fnr family transcriptional regulator n=1 Tax=Rhodospirillum rubrum TaxID=1085 RepID=UPI001903B49E|nr:Crp/Fnr family transcriptional regulator [Rhodospirillum rubrum]MBK1665325.1 Crp/Fnr family transcriptional regulator [Rhodospirillum rubrum]MBK1676513.1 Crp/Fnr family transcriptional regulator [Rhodospirillum rubrum]
MTPEHKDKALAAVSFFDRLPVPRRAELAAKAEAAQLPAGFPLAERGVPATGLQVLVEGQVRLFLPPEESTIDIVGPGSLLGECALCDDARHPVSAQAISPVVILDLRAEDVWPVLLAETDATLALLGAISANLKGLLGRVNDIKLRTTAQRLAMFLVSLARQPSAADRAANNPAEGMVLTLPYGKKLIAERLAMTPESLSRSLARLGREGVRAVGRTTVRIDDLDALALFAGLLPEEENDDDALHHAQGYWR